MCGIVFGTDCDCCWPLCLYVQQMHVYFGYFIIWIVKLTPLIVNLKNKSYTYACLWTKCRAFCRMMRSFQINNLWEIPVKEKQLWQPSGYIFLLCTQSVPNHWGFENHEIIFFEWIIRVYITSMCRMILWFFFFNSNKIRSSTELKSPP